MLMTAENLLKHLKNIHHERLMAAYHDGFVFKDNSDVDALNATILLIKFLDGKKLSDSVTVAEIFRAANIDIR